MVNEKIKPMGQVSFKLIDKEGNVKETGSQNLVVNTGLAFIASRMVDSSADVMSHMGIGSGTTTPADTDLDLETSLGARAPIVTTTIVTRNVAGDSVQYVAEFGPGERTGAVTEAAIFNDAIDGYMLSRTTFPVVNKQATDSLVLTWVITLAQ